MNTQLSADQRAALLLAAMTLEEKVDLMTGDDLDGVVGFSNAEIPRLGIPALRMADAGSGLRRPGGSSPATALPGPLALAATWNRGLGPQYGQLVAREAFALRNNVLLGPNADLARVPWAGRIGESVGEDPTLASEMTKLVPGAVQFPGMMATYKHPMLYNQETDRGAGQNSIADERTIREVYAPPFDAAIKGGAASLMCSFNKINGEFACENDYMQNELLREALGFRGFIMSDYFANHSLSPEKGLDMEEPGLPNEPTYYGDNLLQAVLDGSISMETVDTACRRILWAMFATGLFDTPLPAEDQPIPAAEHARVVEDIEAEAVTLLKNDRQVLPIGPSVDSIAVIGADTDRPSRLGGSSFVTIPFDSRGILEGIQDQAPPGVDVRAAAGTDRIASGDGIFTGFQPLSSSVQSPPGQPDVPGVATDFYAGTNFDNLITSRVEPDVTFNNFVFNVFMDIVRPGPPRATRSLASRSVLTIPKTGRYRFSLSGWGEAWLRMGDPANPGAAPEVIRLTSPGRQGTALSEPMNLQQGDTYYMEVGFRATGARAGGLEPGSVQLGWSHPQDAYSEDMLEAADLAASSDVAVVYARTVEGEQQDSGILALPRDQETLIRAVAAANPNTVVVLGTAVPVLTPWASEVAGVVQGYYGGQEQGDALARVLFGRVNPSGKLPYTMARNEGQYAAIGIDNPVRREGDLDVRYEEGVHLGYRGFDRRGLTPQFSFGHGLSYTTFAYDGMQVTPKSTDGTRPITVSFRLRNTGSVAGAEVAQAYLSLPRGYGAPLKKLVGFDKVTLAPGESRRVSLTIDPNDVTHPLSWWNSEGDAWVTPRGTYTVRVGTSSGALSLEDTFVVDGAATPPPPPPPAPTRIETDVKVKLRPARPEARRPFRVKARVTAETGLPRGKVVFRIDGRKVAILRVRDGRAVLRYRQGLRVGTHRLKVRFKGSGRYEDSTARLRFTVRR